MTRKRTWEIGAAATLVLALTVMGGAGYAWQQRKKQELQREQRDELQLRLDRALADAMDGCRLPKIRSLVRQGASVDTVGRQGFTALQVAAGEGEVDLVKELVDRGAVVDIRPKADAPSVWQRSRLDATALLLAAGYEGRWPIWWGAASGATVAEPDVAFPAEATRYVRVAKLLIARGADVNAVGGSGQTPLRCAAAVGNQPLVQLLLEHGADPNLCVRRNPTALQSTRRPGIIRLLRQHGAKQ